MCVYDAVTVVDRYCVCDCAAIRGAGAVWHERQFWSARGIDTHRLLLAVGSPGGSPDDHRGCFHAELSGSADVPWTGAARAHVATGVRQRAGPTAHCRIDGGAFAEPA